MINLVPFDPGLPYPQYEEPQAPLVPPPFAARDPQSDPLRQRDVSNTAKTGRLIDQNPKLCLTNVRDLTWARAVNAPVRHGQVLVPCDQTRTTPPTTMATPRTTQTPGPDGKCEKQVYGTVGIGLYQAMRAKTIRVDCDEVNNPQPSRCGIG